MAAAQKNVYKPPRPLEEPCSLSPFPSQGLAVQHFLWVCELLHVISRCSTSNLFSLHPLFFLPNQPWFACNKRNLMMPRTTVAHARLFSSLHKNPDIWHRWWDCLLSNLIWNAARFLVSLRGDEAPLDVTQIGWASHWKPWLLLYTHFETILITLSYHPKHVQSHNTFKRKLMFYWGAYGICEKEVTSHAYHQAET